MTKPSMTDLERAETSLLAGLVGESASTQKLSSFEMARERVRLLGLLAQNGVGNGGGTGTAFAEAYGPTADRPTGVNPGFQYFDTDLSTLLVWNGSEWEVFSSGAHTVVPVAAHDTVTLTTPSIAPGATHSTTASLGETFFLRYLTLDKPGRVQAYLSDAARTADAARAFGEAFPAALAPYIFFDTKLPHEGSLTTPANLAGSGLLYVRVTNTGGAAQVITASFERLVLEPESVN